MKKKKEYKNLGFFKTVFWRICCFYSNLVINNNALSYTEMQLGGVECVNNINKLKS
jgi:hypothetical protein